MRRVVSPKPPAMALQEAMLEEFRVVFLKKVAPMVWWRLGLGQTGLVARCKRWAYAPLAYTLDRRRNFFRSVFTLLAAPRDITAEVSAELAASIEIAWSCALILDDLFDQSDEREGASPAYRVFGVLHSLLAVALALGHLAIRFFVTMPGPPRIRAARAVFSLKCTLRCMATQLPGREPRSLKKYAGHARDVNISHHWALLASLAGRKEYERAAARLIYANHMTVAGKMRNDLLDYFGGSSERESQFDDFRARRSSFPTMILEASEINWRDRQRLTDHFRGAVEMEAGEILDMFQRYAVGQECIKSITTELCKARAALLRMTELGESAQLTDTLSRWTDFVEDVCRERIDHHERLFQNASDV